MCDAFHTLRLRSAMNSPEEWVCRIVYRDTVGRVTERLVSPIRFDGPLVLCLCLGSVEPRGFRLRSIEDVQLVRAETVLCPDEKVKLLERRFHAPVQF
jgi:hypothetical protein